MSNATPPLQLHDLLMRIDAQLKLLTQRMGAFEERFTSALRDVEAQLDAERALMMRKRASRAAVDTPERLSDELAQRVETFYSDMHEPMQLHALTRVYGRRIKGVGKTTEEAVRLSGRVKLYNSAHGGYMLLPMSAWESASDDLRALWLSRTIAEIRQKRLDTHLFAETQIDRSTPLSKNAVLDNTPLNICSTESAPSAPPPQHEPRIPAEPALTDAPPSAMSAPEGTLSDDSKSSTSRTE